MKNPILASILFFTFWASTTFAEPPLAVAEPESVGLSSERLTRITQMTERRIKEGQLVGAVSRWA